MRIARKGPMSRIAVLIVIFALWCAFPPGDGSSASEREDCSLCGMWIDLYMKTRHVVTLEDGTSESFCSIACAAKYIKQHKGGVKMIQAADFDTTELISAENAFYLEGSDIPGVMSYTSRIAFSRLTQAEGFQARHGGRIVSFRDALESIERE